MKFFCLRGSGEHCPVGVALAVRSLPRGIISTFIVVPHNGNVQDDPLGKCEMKQL